MNQRRISKTPLIDPAICALIFMGPASGDGRSRRATSKRDRAQTILLQAAAAMNVPAFYLLRRSGKGKRLQKCARGSPGADRKFILDEYRCPWAERDFVDALLREDRSILLIIGSWLEHQIVGTALHGLAEGATSAVPLTQPRHSPSMPRDQHASA